MTGKLAVQCPAKINLFLEVTGKRPDGYHRLATIFAKINLYDVLRIALSADSSGPELHIEDGSDRSGLGADEDNLVLKAARAFYKIFKIKVGARIALEKKIPVGAGLGGGSSDAAGTLTGLARLFEIKGAKSDRLLLQAARSLGADVPFFLNPHALCLGRGIGDRLTPLRVKGSLPYLILAYPGVSISTAESYGNLVLPDEKNVLTRLSQLDRLKKSLERGGEVSTWGGLIFNRLEDSPVAARPVVSRARDILGRLGLIGARMSGSGSCVFGFAPSYEEGVRVLGKLRAYPWKTFLTSCL